MNAEELPILESGEVDAFQVMLPDSGHDGIGVHTGDKTGRSIPSTGASSYSEHCRQVDVSVLVRLESSDVMTGAVRRLSSGESVKEDHDQQSSGESMKRYAAALRYYYISGGG